MKKNLIIVSALSIALTGTFYGFSISKKNNSSNRTERVASASEDDQRINMPDLTGWPEASKKAAKAMESKYGKPNGVTSDMLIWNNNGGWLKTIVYKREMKHDFPKPHTDVLEQWMNYRVPLNYYDELAMYDGSVTVNRTNGTISARCDNEAMNILALNLAHDISSKGKSVEIARNDYGKNATAFMKGEKPTYTQKLNFSNDKSAPDADKPLEAMKAKLGMGAQ